MTSENFGSLDEAETMRRYEAQYHRHECDECDCTDPTAIKGVCCDACAPIDAPTWRLRRQS